MIHISAALQHLAAAVRMAAAACEAGVVPDAAHGDDLLGLVHGLGAYRALGRCCGGRGRVVRGGVCRSSCCFGCCSRCSRSSRSSCLGGRRGWGSGLGRRGRHRCRSSWLSWYRCNGLGSLTHRSSCWCGVVGLCMGCGVRCLAWRRGLRERRTRWLRRSSRRRGCHWHLSGGRWSIVRVEGVAVAEALGAEQLVVASIAIRGAAVIQIAIALQHLAAAIRITATTCEALVVPVLAQGDDLLHLVHGLRAHRALGGAGEGRGLRNVLAG